MQPTGSFKERGAVNKLEGLTQEERRRGVIAMSAGNHAQAVAYHARRFGIPATIVMPVTTPFVKVAATRSHGAEVVLHGDSVGDAQTRVEQLVAERGYIQVHPYDDARIVAGQGTAAKELIEDAGALDALLVPCGGGGLLSGCAVAAKHLAPKCRVVGVEPAAGDDATQSFVKKRLVTIAVPDTIADGARTPSLGKLTFPLVLRHVDDMLTVTDEELLEAMFFLWERMKIVVEPTGALAFSALFHRKFDAKKLRVGVVLSGGNVDLRWAAAQLHKR
jgi:threonine dehydratase